MKVDIEYYRYCYLCNQQMGEKWVCADCVDKYALDFAKLPPTVKSPELVAFEKLPSRKSPDDPIPEKVVDYVIEYLSDDLRLVVRLAQHRAKLMGYHDGRML